MQTTLPASPADALLRGGGTSLLLDLTTTRPRVLHWGTDLGPLGTDPRSTLRAAAVPLTTHNSTDAPRSLSIVPTEADAWSGTPGIAGRVRGGGAFSRLVLAGAVVDERTGRAELDLHDAGTGLRVHLTYTLDRHGLLTVGTRVEIDSGAYDLESVTALLPLPERAVELLDFTGKWSHERTPQRVRLGMGTHLRESRRGRPSLDSPTLLVAGTPGFAFRTGEVWAVHVAWSGNQRYLAEQLPEGTGLHRTTLGGGELLLPGEVTVEPGHPYEAPPVVYAWSGTGLDGLSDAFHDAVRAHPRHRSTPRPLTLNTWEAVYFDHDLPTLERLVDAAAEIGVERIVLDDGWFEGRRDDTGGLGDWYVDTTVWPDGLHPLVDRVRGHGMQFGLWVEPEMISLGSRLAAEHPDWILAPSAGTGPSFRNQFVLNLGHPDAWAYLLERLDSLVTEYEPAYLKWDHNRELHESSRRDAGDAPGVHEQTLALYRLLDELHRRHPRLEIESCASGGGRADLGVVARTDRLWTSDCNDPVERSQIQRWTAQVFPLELLGSHVGAAAAHTTGRVTDLSYRLTTALFGHAGIEMDVTSIGADERARLEAWAGLYKELRPLLHTGRLVRADLADPATSFDGVVAQDRSAAVLAWARRTTSVPVQVGLVCVPGLDPDRTYRVRLREEVGETSLHEGEPTWFAAARGEGLEVSGAVLGAMGLTMPTLNPQQALLLHLVAVDDAP